MQHKDPAGAYMSFRVPKISFAMRARPLKRAARRLWEQLKDCVVGARSAIWGKGKRSLCLSLPPKFKKPFDCEPSPELMVRASSDPSGPRGAGKRFMAPAPCRCHPVLHVWAAPPPSPPPFGGLRGLRRLRSASSLAFRASFEIAASFFNSVATCAAKPASTPCPDLRYFQPMNRSAAE